MQGQGESPGNITSNATFWPGHLKPFSKICLDRITKYEIIKSNWFIKLFFISYLIALVAKSHHKMADTGTIDGTN
jgi:hypothetical protein